MKTKHTEEVKFIRLYAEKNWPPKGAKGASIARTSVSDFLGVEPSAIQNWLSGRNEPLGLSLIKLRYFLEAVGYPISVLITLKENSPVLYKLGELLALGIVSIDKVREELKYRSANEVFRIMHGGSSCKVERIDGVERVIRENEAGLNNKRNQLLRLVGKAVSNQKVSSGKSETSTKSQDHENHSSLTKESMIQSVGHGLLCILPLIELLASDDFTSEDRKYLREIMGYDVVSRTVDALRRLTSETSRRQLSGGVK